MVPSGLLSLALLAPAAPPPLRLQRGDELTYTGAVTETVDRPGTRFRRAHDLEVRVFVLDRGPSWVDAAVLTTLRRADDGAIATASGPAPGRGPAPPAARLDLVRAYDDGTAALLLPPGPAPLRLSPTTPVRGVPAPPLDSFAAFEFGMLPPRPGDGPRVVASADPARPPETWEETGAGVVKGERCARLVMTQRTPGWAAPRGGQTDWERVDEVWVSAQDGAARRVRRVVGHRDGVGPELAVRVETAYELKDQARLIQRGYDRYRREIEIGYAAAADLAPLLRDAARLGPRPFAARLARLAPDLDETDPGTPYREALRAVRRALEAAQQGEAPPADTPPLPGTTAPAVTGSLRGQPPPGRPGGRE